MIEELLKAQLAEQKKTNELLQAIVSNQEQNVKIDGQEVAKAISASFHQSTFRKGL